MSLKVYYRLMQDWNGKMEGMCITEDKYRHGVHYTERCLYEPILEDEIEDWIKWENEAYCRTHGVEFLLFFQEIELMQFLNKIDNAGRNN